MFKRILPVSLRFWIANTRKGREGWEGRERQQEIEGREGREKQEEIGGREGREKEEEIGGREGREGRGKEQKGYR